MNKRTKDIERHYEVERKLAKKHWLGKKFPTTKNELRQLGAKAVAEIPIQRIEALPTTRPETNKLFSLGSVIFRKPIV